MLHRGATRISSIPKRCYVSAEQLTIVREKHFHLSKFADAVETFAGKEPTRRTVAEQLEFGERVMRDSTLLIESARFLQEEMLIRLARTIRSFQNLPYIVGINPRIQDVYVKCWDWFVTLHEWTQEHGMVQDQESEQRFTEHLLQVFHDHGNIWHSMRTGIKEVRELPSSDSVDFEYVNTFLTQFILRRISWRVLAETHLALKHPKNGQNGVFNLKCRPSRIGMDCLSKAQYLCEAELASAPDFVMKGDLDTHFEYIDAHLQYILLELAKNSMRATANFHAGKPMPKVVLRVCHGDEITISLHDKGGGIPKDQADNIWSYGFTTVKEHSSYTGVNAYFPGMRGDSLEQEATEGDRALAGWGFGLPMSRCYVKYLGGRLDINNMPGYGCDTILTLPKLSSSDCREWLDFA